MTSKYAKVEGYPNLLRDLDTNAIINIDSIEYDNYTIAKIKREQEQMKMQYIENELDNLKSSMEEIKQLLKSIVNES